MGLLGKLFFRREACSPPSRSANESLGPVVIIGVERPDPSISLPSPNLNFTDDPGGWKYDGNDGVSVDPKLDVYRLTVCHISAGTF
jgi:hypothetical protein